jgi:hypothetical protein
VERANVDITIRASCRGHLKATLAFEPKPEDENDPRESEQFYKIMADRFDACISTGCVLNSWKTVANAMLEKIPGVPRINKLRVIHLFVVDLNLVLGIL